MTGPIPRRRLLQGGAAIGAGTALGLIAAQSANAAPASTSPDSTGAATTAAVTPAATVPNQPPAPLFRDPIFDGASDPTVIYNRQTGEWWMFYTGRRANVAGQGVAWVHGSDIGIASSSDGGRTWLYRGVAEGLSYQPGRNTYWAPEILWDGSKYHMFVVFITGVPINWTTVRTILHYTSDNLWNWEFIGPLTLSSGNVIDPCIYPLPQGSAHRWRMWFKDEGHSSHIYSADSDDLTNWTVNGPVLTNKGQEAPQVFWYDGFYWMGTAGPPINVYRSTDLSTWTIQSTPLLGDPGTRTNDSANGNHPFFLSQGGSAYIVYFTDNAGGPRVSAVQAAPLYVNDGVLSADRNTPFSMNWDPNLTVSLRGGNVGLPGVAFSTPGDGQAVGGQVQIAVQLTGTGLRAYDLRVDGGGLQYQYQPKPGTVTFTLDTTTLTNGRHTLLATATDEFGQKYTVTRPVVVAN
ncbi:hypothetical protein GCM10023322_57410 [Rugosimonospora acidiphila]|uniref:Uncharacterized protein n=1 Tax=Rugosimonospora acidiphila TaxID=556531 RepID=A0ABP9SF15_9ACTN